MALTFEKKNRASQRTGQTSQPNLQDEVHWEVCFSQIRPAGTTQLLPRSWWNHVAPLEIQGHQVAALQKSQDFASCLARVFVEKVDQLVEGHLWKLHPNIVVDEPFEILLVVGVDVDQGMAKSSNSGLGYLTRKIKIQLFQLLRIELSEIGHPMTATVCLGVFRIESGH